MQELLDTADVAGMFKVPVETVRGWRHCGTGPPYLKVGRHVRYRAEDVDDWLRQCAAATASAGAGDG